MTTSGRIVVGVDGSISSLDAVRWARRQAELTGADLEAVISWKAPTQYGNEFSVEEISWRELAKDTLLAAIQQAGDGTSISCTQTVAEGHPAQTLITASAEADLLVVGSRGHDGFAGMLIGSVSAHVIAHAACPVVVVRHQSPQTQAV